MLVQQLPHEDDALFQFDAIKRYVENGGSVLVLMGEGGETRFDTNINFLLEEYGIMVNTGKVHREMDQRCMNHRTGISRNFVS